MGTSHAALADGHWHSFGGERGAASATLARNGALRGDWRGFGGRGFYGGYGWRGGWGYPGFGWGVGFGWGWGWHHYY